MPGKVFKVWPKRTKRLSGQVITPEMVVIVTTKYYTPTPFYNGWEEVRAVYMNMYLVDIKRMGCCQADFNFEVIDKF